ncbi:GATA type transcriptional activator of nitrogen-regulated proteins [Tieghemiomyces parasiticus]|uniref:GATA type transcriptional activator of nitrogen-regulated proteins n=1 Tax=Tieghemiomyces parasiticus TaxID=78921 RepID=A0A9W8DZS5_9FUNG|nr:GATA type transcriptional activator of nitrogen-regulated proteins [Tieghemiomyces parasiticus]
MSVSVSVDTHNEPNYLATNYVADFLRTVNDVPEMTRDTIWYGGLDSRSTSISDFNSSPLTSPATVASAGQYSPPELQLADTSALPILDLECPISTFPSMESTSVNGHQYGSTSVDAQLQSFNLDAALSVFAHRQPVHLTLNPKPANMLSSPDLSPFTPKLPAYDGDISTQLNGTVEAMDFVSQMWDTTSSPALGPLDGAGLDHTTARLAQMLIDSQFNFWPPQAVPGFPSFRPLPTHHAPLAASGLPMAASAPPSPQEPTSFIGTSTPVFHSASGPIPVLSCLHSPTSGTFTTSPGPKRNKRPTARRRRSAGQSLPTRQVQVERALSAPPDHLATLSLIAGGPSADLPPGAILSTTTHPSATYDANGDLRLCANCGIIATPTWRRTRDAHILMCNACGLYYHNHRQLRPWLLSRSVVKKDRSGLSIWLATLPLSSVPPAFLTMGGIGPQSNSSGRGRSRGQVSNENHATTEHRPIRVGSLGRAIRSPSGECILVEDNPHCCRCARDSSEVSLHPCAQRAYYVCADCARDLQRRLNIL